MRRPVLLLLASANLAACNPYMAAVTAVSQTYGVATDERSLSTQASDTEIEAKMKAALIESPVSGTGSLTALCRRGVVVITGVVPPGSNAGAAAVQLARQTPGVKRVETFFVATQPSEARDLEIAAKINAAFVADSNLLAEQWRFASTPETPSSSASSPTRVRRRSSSTTPPLSPAWFRSARTSRSCEGRQDSRDS